MKKELNLETLLTSDKLELKNLSFEQGLKLLEELVAKVEEGTLPIDSAMNAYEKGVSLIEHLQGQLNGAEEKLKILRKRSKNDSKGLVEVEEKNGEY
ncbi:MAG: exodeoxyribonuclease VII small subunit [SAR324 cluster bacterium]|uniref:Exodeoxyribonuclease 7 small subunit n=1 Tax=SAR324 cluster bacterium TaxID=2024889 RepID=A0A7X9IJI9_9DELT|nr:exodeoxyribonuclease VII small subunit [SAR324 cluster bacterium]